jgi:hypothetical protein
MKPNVQISTHKFTCIRYQENQKLSPVARAARQKKKRKNTRLATVSSLIFRRWVMYVKLA